MKFYFEGYFENTHQRDFELNVLYIYKENLVYGYNMKQIVREILDNKIEVHEYENLDKWKFDEILFDLNYEEDKKHFENLIHKETIKEINKDKVIELIKSHLIIEMFKYDNYKADDLKRFLGEEFLMSFFCE